MIEPVPGGFLAISGGRQKPGIYASKEAAAYAMCFPPSILQALQIKAAQRGAAITRTDLKRAAVLRKFQTGATITKGKP